MLTYSNTKHVHVYTKEELLKDLDKVIDSTEKAIGPDQLANLQKVRAAITQLYDRIEQLCETITNLQKVTNTYELKVNSMSQGIKQSLGKSQGKNEKSDPVEKALRKIEENVNMH